MTVDRIKISFALLLVAATLAVFWPVKNFAFVNYDDPEYVTANSHVLGGLTASNVAWAFSTGEMGSWHPLTWLSLQADAQFFSASPRAFHLTNLALHVANTLLVFSLLLALTGAQLRAALVAALFALHPLHVETVAWIADRKDLLAAFFALLTLRCYTDFVQRSAVRNQTLELTADLRPQIAVRYWLSLLAFAAALLCKPSVIALPAVLLLLDFWPLGRFQLPTSNFQLLTKKIPFVLLAAVAALLTLATQTRGGFVVELPFTARLAHAPVAVCTYLAQIFWPRQLAVFYPHPGHEPLLVVLAATALVVGLSVLAFVRRHAWPQFFVGWFWFLALLLPVLGLVQAGEQAHADRYTYLPLMGFFVAVVWSVPNVIARLNWLLGVAAISVCALTTRAQLRHWRDSETLFTHAATVTRGNYLAENNLGVVHLERGAFAVAAERFRAALAARPGYPFAHNNLGLALANLGDTAAAETEFRAATQRDSNYAEAHRNLGTMLARRGEFASAVTEYQLALALGLDTPEVHANLARAQAALK
jgi:tetratricopeptide (TPR) repeat protein